MLSAGSDRRNCRRQCRVRRQLRVQRRSWAVIGARLNQLCAPNVVSIHWRHGDSTFDVARTSRPALVDPRYRVAVRPSRTLIETLLQSVYDKTIARPPDVVAKVVDATLNLVLRAISGGVDRSIGFRARQAGRLTDRKLDCVGGCSRQVACLNW